MRSIFKFHAVFVMVHCRVKAAFVDMPPPRSEIYKYKQFSLDVEPAKQVKLK